MKTIKKMVDSAIAENHFIEKRREVLEKKLIKIGVKFHFDELPMGSGGVGQYKQMNDGSVRFQIGYGHGRYNYATVLVVRF